ncbi:fibrous sheath CABYR-binding protein-like isoform X2 [Numida meleagris]|uniref:fibrous sheath CABYR-binding protein-like isoform X2 n=1 Tax=Numida meleagris TaxID=8996 RepID=UPI000B3DF426|nr:fibrous sheath CABYR-binding protein-like isoform X2 [Numida meleagris]
MPKEEKKKNHSQPDKGLLSMQECRQVGRRPHQAVPPGSWNQESSLREVQQPSLSHLESAHASADRKKLRQALPHSSHSREARQPLSTLPSLPRQAMPLAAAPQHAAAAKTHVPKLPALQAPASMRSPRGRDHELIPCPQGNAQQHDMAARTESWEADRLVPVPPLKPAHATPKSLRLAYQRRPVAARPKPSQKPAGPKQDAPTSSLGTPTRSAQVLTIKAESGPTDKMPPDPSAEGGTRDADGAPTSRSEATQQAAEDGAKAAGISESTLGAKDTEKSPRFRKKLRKFMSCSRCKIRYLPLEVERRDVTARHAATQTDEVPVRTPSGEAEARPAASGVAVSSQHEADSLELRQALPFSSDYRKERQSTCGESLLVPAPPLQPAHATPKSLRLAYRRRPVAARPKLSQKLAGPKQDTPTDTLGTPTRSAQVLTVKADESGLADTMRPDPSAEEGTRDIKGAPTSPCLAVQGQEDDGAKAASTSQGIPSAEDIEQMLLSSCLCLSICIVLDNL